jgi:DNA-binding MarR family transcriptional regulator
VTRSRLVELTARGKEVIERVIRREHAQLRGVTGDLTAADLESTRRVLVAMLPALDEVEPG